MTKVVMPLPEAVTRTRIVDVYLQGADSPVFEYETAGQYGGPGKVHGARVSRLSIRYTKEGDDSTWSVHTMLYTRHRNANGTFGATEKGLRDSLWPEGVNEFVKATEQEHTPDA